MRPAARDTAPLALSDDEHTLLNAPGPEAAAALAEQMDAEAEAERFRERLDLIVGVLLVAIVFGLLVLVAYQKLSEAKHAADCIRDTWGVCIGRTA